jgi:CheY-like chemotaxis protein
MLQSEIVMEIGRQPIPALETKRQLLVIEDNKTVREALSRMFVSLGYNVTLAGNGFNGGLLFCTRDYDLVIIDLQVPQLNVWELSRIFKQRSPSTPVMIITGFSKDKYWGNSDTNNVDAIIPKPFKLNEIEKLVQKLLNSGT